MSIQSEPQLISLKSAFHLSLIGGQQIGLHCSLAIAAEFSVKNDPVFFFVMKKVVSLLIAVIKHIVLFVELRE